MTSQISVGITVNGEEKYFAEAPTMTELLVEMGLPEKASPSQPTVCCFRVAAGRETRQGAQIEILTAVQGG